MILCFNTQKNNDMGLKVGVLTFVSDKGINMLWPALQSTSFVSTSKIKRDQYAEVVTSNDLVVSIYLKSSWSHVVLFDVTYSFYLFIYFCGYSDLKGENKSIRSWIPGLGLVSN